MGKTNTGVLGAFVGTIGPLTGYMRNGQNILRSSTSSIKNQRTPLQLAQREKIRICTNFTRAFTGSGFLDKSFPAYRHSGNGYKRAVSALMSRALTGVYPDIHLNYAEVLVSKGKLPAPKQAKAVLKAKNSYWRATFGLVCKLSYAILEPHKSYDEINNYDGDSLAEIFDRIAYINVKKTSGGSSVNYIDFNKYIADKSYMKCLQKQIKDINPHIVYCGGTFEYVFPNLKEFNLYTDWIHEKDKIKYINGWHPNAKINHEEYFGDIRRILIP